MDSPRGSVWPGTPCLCVYERVEKAPKKEFMAAQYQRDMK